MEEQKTYEQDKEFPINNLDSAWLAAQPNYTKIQNEYDKISSFSPIFTLFNSGIRLSKLSDGETKIVQYDLITAGMALNNGLYDLALSVFFDVATCLEANQSRKGFRTEAMNTVIQQIKSNMGEQQTKSLLGGKKQQDD